MGCFDPVFAAEAAETTGGDPESGAGFFVVGIYAGDPFDAFSASSDHGRHPIAWEKEV